MIVIIWKPALHRTDTTYQVFIIFITLSDYIYAND